MCIKKVEAFSFEGKTFATEGQAIAAAVGKLLDNTGIAQKVIDNSSALLPYLQRIIEIDSRYIRQPKSDEEDEAAGRTTLPPPIPELVYWSAENGNFYGQGSNRGQGQDFYDRWYTRRAEFPTSRHEDDKPLPPIPDQVYWDASVGTFVTMNGVVKGGDFYASWYDRRAEFPTQTATSFASARSAES